MSTITVQSVSAINSLRGSYVDTSVSVEQYRAGYEQGFILNKIKGLENPTDVTINNYTTQYLTNTIPAKELLRFDEKDIGLRTLTTPIIANPSSTTGGERYLFFGKNEKEAYATSATQFFGLTSSSEYNSNIYFEIEFLNNAFLRIKHNDGTGDFFLNTDILGAELSFLKYVSDVTTLSPTKRDIFRYTLDADGYLQLFKDIGGGTSKIVTYQGNKLTLQPIVSGGSYINTSNIFGIRYSFTELDTFINNSWVSYKTKAPNTYDIDKQKSVFDKNGQYLLHGKYNIAGDTIDLNFLTLNSFRSEKNFLKRGVRTTTGYEDLPDTSSRIYTSLNTGTDQERGNDNITLTYLWYDEDIYIKNGRDTHFTAPSSIYPYERLNINDTCFTSQGAFAGPAPILSDKVYFLNSVQNEKGNGRYLCTWLSAGESGQKGVWVDRYYYPDIVLKRSALSATSYAPSYETVIDGLQFADIRSVAVKGFYDKRSDVYITPDSKYIYSRVDNTDVLDVVSTSSPIVTGFNNLYNTLNIPRPYAQDSITYEGSSYNRYSITDSINASRSFTISFEALIDPTRKYGYQIIGNLTDSGFGVINDETVTPFVYVTQDNKLNVYNTDFVLVQSVVFEKNIIDIVDSKFLEPFFVICEEGYIYKLTAAGVKVKLEIVPDIINYIGLAQDQDTIIFLKNTAGSCFRVDKKTLTPQSLTTVMLPSLSSRYTEQKGLVRLGDSFYGLPGENIKFVNDETIFFTISSQYLIKQNLITGTTTPFLSSVSTIIDYDILQGNAILVLHNKTKLTVLDENRNVETSIDYKSAFGDSAVLQGMDVVREYVNGVETSYPIIAGVSESNIFLSKLDAVDPSAEFTGLTGNENNYLYTTPYTVKNKYHLTNYNYFKRLPQTDGLNFKTTLTNYLSTEDTLTTSIRVTENDIDAGYHTFTYRFDSLRGSITLFIDGRVFKTVRIPAGKYKIQTLFNDDLYIGTTGFYNGRDLATFLGQPGYYYVSDLLMRDLFIYDRSISDTEVYALHLKRKKIDDIVISIPAGQRNNIETINRYFKFGSSASSNSVDIVVKNANIIDESSLSKIRNLILFEAKRTLPIGVNINNIEFIDYK